MSEYELIWNQLDKLCNIAFGSGHEEQFSGSPSMSTVYVECLNAIIERNKIDMIFWDNWYLISELGTRIKCCYGNKE